MKQSGARTGEGTMVDFTDLQLMVLEKEHIECRDVRMLLGDYCDGDLPPTLKGRLEGHIAECGCCREMTGEYQLTIRLAKELRDQPVPADVQRRLRRNLNQRLGLNLPVGE